MMQNLYLLDVFVNIDTFKMLALTKFQISKEPVCFGLFTVPDDTKVIW